MRPTFWTCESWSIRVLYTVGAGINKVLYKTTTWGVTLNLLTWSKPSQSYHNTKAASCLWGLLRRKRVCFARSLSPLSLAWSIVQAFHLTKWRRTTGTLCNSQLSIFKASLILFFRLRILRYRIRSIFFRLITAGRWATSSPKFARSNYRLGPRHLWYSFKKEQI